MSIEMVERAAARTKFISRPHAPSPEDLQQILADLYRRQLGLDSDDGYLTEHASPKAVRNHVGAFLWYAPLLPRRGAILDWGCNHAPDSCLLRAAFGDRFTLHGCDFRPSEQFGAFQDFGAFRYAQVTDPLELPFAASSFDAVIGSGALEHCALDYEALKQIYRVLKPGGRLVITYLPNRLSVREWYHRVVKGERFHRRRYGFSEAVALLKRTGFYPLAGEYDSFSWQKKFAAVGLKRVEKLGARMSRIMFPIHLFSPTLRFVAEKVTCM